MKKPMPLPTLAADWTLNPRPSIYSRAAPVSGITQGGRAGERTQASALQLGGKWCIVTPTETVVLNTL